MIIDSILNARALRFVELAEYLHRNNWIHFQLQGGGWTEELEGEEKVFGIIIRTLLCNDSESKQFYDDLGNYSGVKSRYNSGDDVIPWLDLKLARRKMGSGKGSHRDGRHKQWTAQGIKEYLDLTRDGQQEYFSKLQGYTELFNGIHSLCGCGPLTAFDVAKSMYESGVFAYIPDRFYLTGSGEVKGLKTLFPDANSDEELVRMGDALTSAILQRTGMLEEIVHYGVEDLLCIYQKKGNYLDFLDGNEFDVYFAEDLLGKNCFRERGIGC